MIDREAKLDELWGSQHGPLTDAIHTTIEKLIEAGASLKETRDIIHDLVNDATQDALRLAFSKARP